MTRPYHARIKIELKRRPPQPRPENACIFVCAGCEATTETHEEHLGEWIENHRPPLCHRCLLRHGTGRVLWVNGMTGDEYSGLQRLGAIINLIAKEVAYGRRIRATQ